MLYYNRRKKPCQRLFGIGMLHKTTKPPKIKWPLVPFQPRAIVSADMFVLLPQKHPPGGFLGPEEFDREIRSLVRVKFPAGKDIDVSGIPELGKMPRDRAGLNKLQHRITRGMSLIVTEMRQKRLAVFLHLQQLTELGGEFRKLLGRTDRLRIAAVKIQNNFQTKTTRRHRDVLRHPLTCLLLFDDRDF